MVLLSTKTEYQTAIPAAVICTSANKAIFSKELINGYNT